MLLCEALFPYLMPSILNLSLPSAAGGVGEIFYASSRIGFLVTFDNSQKSTRIEFFDDLVLSEAFAHDIARLSCASFQSIAQVSEDILKTSSVPWCLIKAYYSAFYAAHAILRMIGQSCSFLQSSQIGRISAVASAMGSISTFVLERGVQHIVTDYAGSAFAFKKAGSSNAGSHEVFWRIFVGSLRTIQERVLQGPLTRSENQAVYNSLFALTQSLKEETWLSLVRNEIQYRQSYGSWFPSKIADREKVRLSGLAVRWKDDPLNVSIEQSSNEIDRFISTCVLIVAMCKNLIEFVSERSDAGTRCFTFVGPMKFLRTGGFI